MRLLNSIRIALAAAALALAPALVPVAVLAAPDTTSVCEGVSLGGGTCGGDTSSLSNTVKLVINILSIIAAIAAVIMIIVGGLKYITSGGDSGKTAGAKNTIIFAIVGLIVVALSQFIVKFVLTKAGK